MRLYLSIDAAIPTKAEELCRALQLAQEIDGCLLKQKVDSNDTKNYTVGV